LNSRVLSFRTAVLLGSIILAFFGMAAAVGLILTSAYLHNAAQSIKEAVDSVAASEELHVNLLEHNRQNLLFEYTGDIAYARRRDEAEQSLNQGIEVFGFYVNTEAERALVSEIKALVSSYLALGGGDDLKPVPLDELLADSLVLNDITVRIRALIQLNQDQAEAIRGRVEQQNELADVLGFTVITALLLCLALLIWGARTVLYKPLIALQETVRRFGKGDYKVRTESSGPRELREVAAVFNEMADNLEGNYQNLNRFLAAVAHDLRNPIGAIKMSMDVIATMRQGQSPEIQEITDIVRRQSDQLNQLVSDLLDRTHMEAGELVLHLKKNDLRSIATQAVGLYQSVSELHPIQLELPDEPVVCNSDPTRMGQVLNNLLSNAIKYSPSGSPITVKIERKDPLATISVSDQGMGIEADDSERIFEPFKRSRSTRDTIPGVGLGLFASRRLIEAHGGCINVRSEPGHGSTFIVQLPLAEASPPS
jgi:two-component system sensor histidine kinase MtrB